MAFLNDGGGATKAVESAIKSLEDDQNTNAEYESNLTVDGHRQLEHHNCWSLWNYARNLWLVNRLGQLATPI